MADDNPLSFAKWGILHDRNGRIKGYKAEFKVSHAGRANAAKELLHQVGIATVERSYYGFNVVGPDKEKLERLPEFIEVFPQIAQARDKQHLHHLVTTQNWTAVAQIADPAEAVEVGTLLYQRKLIDAEALDTIEEQASRNQSPISIAVPRENLRGLAALMPPSGRKGNWRKDVRDRGRGPSTPER